MEYILAESRRTGYNIEEIIEALSIHWNMIYFFVDGRADVAMAVHCVNPHLLKAPTPHVTTPFRTDEGYDDQQDKQEDWTDSCNIAAAFLDHRR